MKIALRNNSRLFLIATLLFVLTLAVALITAKYYLLALPFAALLFCTGWQSLSTIFLVLIASIPFSTEFQFSDSLGTDLPDELLMLLVTLLTFFYLIKEGTTILKQITHPLTLLLLTILCWSGISSMFSAFPVVSVKYLLAKSWYTGAFFIAAFLVWQNKENLKRSALALIIPMLMITLVIIFRHAMKGFSFAAVSDVVHPFFRNHVNYSSLLVCTIPVWYAWWRLSTSANHKRLIIVIAVVLLFALFLSYARGAWLALAVGSVTFWLIRKRILIRAFLTGLLIISISTGWLVNNDRYLDFAPDHNTTIFHEDFREHLVATYEMKDLSAAERFYRWVAGMRMIPERPVVGFGPGTFYQTYRPYAVPAFETWVSDNQEHSTIHNYFLLTAVEQGLPGLILLVILCGAILYYAQNLYHYINDAFYKTASAVIGMIFSMILTLNFLSDLVETDKIGSLFFLCIAALVMIDIRTRKLCDQ